MSFENLLRDADPQDAANAAIAMATETVKEGSSREARVRAKALLIIGPEKLARIFAANQAADRTGSHQTVRAYTLNDGLPAGLSRVSSDEEG